MVAPFPRQVFCMSAALLNLGTWTNKFDMTLLILVVQTVTKQARVPKRFAGPKPSLDGPVADLA